MYDFSPLISVVVITYNSSKYVLETLESVRVQTYLNIELIITDDGSTDSTLKVCREWLKENQKRFVRTQLLTVSKNTGIPANCNRGYRAAKGEWIKGVAGDDALLPDCIKNYVDFVFNNPEIEICHSSVAVYNNTFESKNFIGISDCPTIFKSDKNSSTDQFRLLSFKCMVKAPSIFCKKELIARMGFLDESIPLCEDWPMWLKITHRGTRFYYFDHPSVKYRLVNTSVYTGRGKGHLVNEFYKIEKEIYKKNIKPYLIFFDRLLINYQFVIKDVIFNNFSGKRKFVDNFVYKILISPYVIYYKLFIIKIFHK